jgi:aerobic-type carbon monoxide dehydrogenase small subunit (CoxS/CutS family)
MYANQSIKLTVNGATVERSVPGDQRLLDFLREELYLTGAKDGCSVGVCGLCTVLVDGLALSACLMPAITAQERDIWTIEGISALADEREGSNGVRLRPTLMREVQRAFLECEGLQCGICTPGQVMTAYALLAERADPTTEEIREYMAGNLCRCTGYQSIVQAIELAATRWRLASSTSATAAGSSAAATR